MDASNLLQGQVEWNCTKKQSIIKKICISANTLAVSRFLQRKEICQCIKGFIQEKNLFNANFVTRNFHLLGIVKIMKEDMQKRGILYNCRLCQASYYRNYQLVKHILKRHPNSPVKESSIRLTSGQGCQQISLILDFNKVNVNTQQIIDIKQSTNKNDALNQHQTQGLKLDYNAKKFTIQKSHSMSISDIITDSNDGTKIMPSNSKMKSMNLSEQNRSTQEQDYSPSIFLVKQQDPQIDDTISEYSFGEFVFDSLNSQLQSSQDDQYCTDERYFPNILENYYAGSPQF
ncbi:zinc finger protein 37 [Stylonychia lemnae]|uniref:Zinc finger protein 37 n=1 Tax=Stylonychia lemnae TaxID=5949 RepID=A0A078A4I1_STYLE|nr:zinc finger protein 37 [Stylonychia lemnae]|eukprot:CDW77163.1 zinc finger protein 37 [Stylonychia lemnae]